MAKTKSKSSRTERSQQMRNHQLTAYRLVDSPMVLRCGEQKREWMDMTSDRFAYRCLPLLIANQAGWDLLCPAGFQVRWNGKNGKSSIKLRFDGERDNWVASHFGFGVLTFILGYLFRTTKDHNIWVKGPPNTPKDGIQALEGMVETDWAPFTFTMNWKITRPKRWIRFEKDEPIARIVPFPRHYLESHQPRIKPLEDDRLLARQYLEWNDSRRQFIVDQEAGDEEIVKQGWQRTYVHGKNMKGVSFEGHQTKLSLREFAGR